MADGKVKATVLMQSSTGEQWDIPADKVKEAESMGAKLIPTPAPPTSQEVKPSSSGSSSIPAAVVTYGKNAASSLFQGFTELMKDPAEWAVSAVGGAASSALSAPTAFMRMAGVNPLKVPLVVSPVSSFIQPDSMGVSAFPTEEMIKKEQEPLPQKITTFGEAERVVDPKEMPSPEVAAGAKFVTDVFLGSRAAKVLPFAARSIPGIGGIGLLKNKKVESVANLVNDYAVNLTQAYGKTENADEAAESAGLGLIVGLGLKGTLKAGKAAYDKYAPGFAKLAFNNALKSIPMPKGPAGGESIKQRDYQEGLAGRMLEKGYIFTREGQKEITDNFSTIVGSMKNASSEADDVVDELFKLGHVKRDTKYIVDYAKKFDDAIERLRSKQIDSNYLKKIDEIEKRVKDLLPKKLKLDANGNPVQAMEVVIGANNKPLLDALGKPIMKPLFKNGKPVLEETDELRNLTFKETEEKKESVNRVLKEYYENGNLNPEDKLEKRIKLELGGSFREAQSDAFDTALQLKNKWDSKIPAGSTVKNILPGRIKIPGETGEFSYTEAGQLARKEADLSTIAQEVQLQVSPQAASNTSNEMAEMIALGQFLHGSYFTPSQLATLIAKSKGQVSQSIKSRMQQDLSMGVIPKAVADEPGVGLMNKFIFNPLIRAAGVSGRLPSSATLGRAASINRSDQSQPADRSTTEPIPSSSMQSLLDQEQVKVVPKPPPSRIQKPYFAQQY